MSKLHIANYFEADRRSVRAGEAMDLGSVITITDNGSGGRVAMKVTSAGQAVSGIVGVAFKVSADPLQVTASTVNADSGADLGSRIVTIASGDQIVEVRRGAVLEYTADLLDDSLNPAADTPGTTPDVGDILHIKAGKWCEVGASGAVIPATPIAKVYRTFGTKVLVELV
jgi:hypothetical protein